MDEPPRAPSPVRHQAGLTGPAVPAGQRVFVPIALVVLTLLVMVGFQTVQLNRERDALQARLEALSVPFEEARQVRAQLDSIARTTAELAAQGNENARLVVDQLARLGITINPRPASDAPPPAE